jgi:AraC family transcriptional regulator of adaptative response/methylated-DNA-[protein]-cysteine methyltransferase
MADSTGETTMPEFGVGAGAASDPLERRSAALDLAQTVADYARVTRIVEYAHGKWPKHPSLEVMAALAGLSVAHLHQLFERWAGMAPQAFWQAITPEHARLLLRPSASALDTAVAVGLSGSSRLRGSCVEHEAVTPAVFKAGGVGLTLRYGFHPSPFGECVIVATADRLVGLGFADEGDRAVALDDMRRRWSYAHYLEDTSATAAFARRAFNPTAWRPEQPLRVMLIGSEFQVRVWQALLRIPLGQATTYSDIAARINQPTAARAVGAAVGKNAVSFVVPCHRVLGRSGTLTGYHWGLIRKRAIIGWEAGLRRG